MVDLKTRLPHTAIRRREAYFDRLAPLLADGTLDIVIARDTDHPLAVDFHQEMILTDPMTIVCGTQHPLAARQRVSWKELDGASWILPVHGSVTYLLLQELLAAHGVAIPSNSVESISLSANMVLLQSHPFVGLLPLAYVRKYQNEHPDRLAILPLSTGRMLGEIKAVWRKDNANPIVGTILEAVRQQVLLL